MRFQIDTPHSSFASVCLWGRSFSVVFGWTTAIVFKFPVFLGCPFLHLSARETCFYGAFPFFFLSIPVVLSGLLASLPPNLGYLRQKNKIGRNSPLCCSQALWSLTCPPSTLHSEFCYVCFVYMYHPIYF